MSDNNPFPKLAEIRRCWGVRFLKSGGMQVSLGDHYVVENDALASRDYFQVELSEAKDAVEAATIASKRRVKSSPCPTCGKLP